MTVEEIILGLECCSVVGTRCLEYPYRKEVFCREELCEDASKKIKELINDN